MSTNAEIISALKEVLTFDANIRIELAGEEFSTRLLSLDENSMKFVIDRIIPKYGNNFLNPEISYKFDHNKYEAGIVHILEFSAAYKGPGEFNNLPAHYFGVPLEIHRKNTLFDIRPRPNDDISLTCRMNRQKHIVKATRLNIKNVYFNHAVEGIKIDDSGMECGEVILSFQGKKIDFQGRVFKDTKYNYRMEIANIELDKQVELSAFIGVRYRAVMGFRKLNIASDQEKIRSVIKVQAKKSARGKIFIVDSDIMFVDVLSRALSELDYKCSVFNDSPGVVESAVQSKPDIIIMETYLPHYDGFTLLRRLKRTPETSDIPVIMLSGSSDEHDVIDAKEVGALYYLLKPKDRELEGLAERLDAIIMSKDFTV